MNVLHLAANRWWTGSADPTIRLITELTARGHRVSLAVTPGDRFEAKAREAGVPLVGDVRLDPKFDPVGVVRDVARLRRLVREGGIDIVHAHHSHDHWIAWLIAGGRVPIVRTFHNRRSVKTTRVARWLYRRAALAFAVSRQIEARCRDAGFAADRIVWVPGSADLPRFIGAADPAPVREEFKLGTAPVVVSVARLAPNRGHEALVHGFRRLLRDLPDARLLLVGKGETRARLEQLVAEQGLAEQVIFTGYRDRDLPAVLAAADCFVLMAPGSDDSCRAALEAMAAGRPVVAGRGGALPETIVHGETGWLLDDERAESVASAIARVLNDRDRAAAMGDAGRRRAQTVFGPEQGVVIVEGAYRMLR